MTMTSKVKESTLKMAENEFNKENYRVAFSLYEGLVEDCVPEAYFEYGRFLKYGWDCEVDEKKSFDAFLQGAVRGDGMCQWMLASCYKDGEGCDPNPDEAFFWMKEAADIGCVPFAISELANYYYMGIGVEKNYEKSVEYLKQLVDTDLPCAASAQNNLAFCYLKGEGVPKDDEMAKHYFMLAINSSCQGDYYKTSTIESAKNGNADDSMMLKLCGIDF